MWMCDFCQSINDVGADVCPKCGRVRNAIPVRSAEPAGPTFGKSLSETLASTEPTEPVDTSPPTTIPTPPPFGFATPPSSTPHYTAPPVSSKPANAAPIVGGVLIVLGALLLRLLNPARLIFIAVGIACIAGGGYLKHKTESFEAKAVKTTGTVVRLDERGSGGDIMYYPVVDFTAGGSQVEVASSTGSRPASNHVGDSVTVFYNPADPHDAEVDASTSRWLPIGMMIFGWIFVIAALFGRVQSR